MTLALFPKILLSLAALLGGISVILGAFGAHYLKERLSKKMLETFEIGVRYQMYHVLALFIAVSAMHHFPHPLFSYSVWFLLVGILLFSGSLYILALTGVHQWGRITPIGGVSFIIGWFLLFIGFILS